MIDDAPGFDPDFEADRRSVEACLRGRSEAFEALMERHERAVYAAVTRTTGRVEDAWDLTQDVFLEAFHKLHQLRDGGLFRAWVLRIAGHRGLNWTRRRRRRPADQEAGLEGSLLELPSRHRRADDAVAADEEAQVLREALDALNPKSRMAVQLRYLDECSVADVAAVLGLTPGSTRNLLYRSLRRLRSILRTTPLRKEPPHEG